MRTLILTLLGLTAVPFVVVASSGPAAPPAPGAAEIVNEPILVYGVSGSTLAGVVHRQLVVYNSGFASYAKKDSFVIIGGDATEVATASVGPQAATQLLRDLVQAGAATLGDQELMVSDVPLTTLTVLEGAPDARSHTFSYWIGVGEHAEVAGVVNDFIQSTFPSF